MLEIFFFYLTRHLIVVHKTEKSVGSTLVHKVLILKVLDLAICTSSHKNNTISLNFLHLPGPLLADFWLI